MNRNCLILISGGYGNGNSGDEALIICMKNELMERFPNAQIVVFSDNVEVSKRFVPDVKFVYSGRFGIKDKSRKGLAAYFWILHMLHLLFRADIFITGGGTVLQDKTHPFFVPFWFFKIILAQLFLTPTMFYGIGAGPLERRSSRFLMNFFGRRMNYITVRGPLSERWVRKFKVPSERIEVTADPAVSLRPAEKKRACELLEKEGVRLDVGRATVCFCIREWYKFHAKSIANKDWSDKNRKKYESMIQSITAFTKHLIEAHDAQILFLPMSIFKPNDDREAAALVKEQLESANVPTDSLYLISGDYSPEEQKSIIGQCDTLVSMRFHPLIYAMTQGIPVIGIAYGLKTFDFLEYIGLDRFGVTVDDTSGSRLIQLFSALTFEKNSLHKFMGDKAKELKNEAQRNVNIVESIIKCA